MDETTYETLSKLKLDDVALIRLSDFEDKRLLKVKPTRTPVEYYWTCTPSLPLYIFKHFPDVEVVSYLDADLCFFSSPEPIFEEMTEKSIMIIPHRFADRQKLKEKMNGIFNVGMLTFRRDKEGLKSLGWWRERCLEWCFYKFENGKIGDQKYLDQFPKLFKSVCILKHPGTGVGVWNIRQYKVSKRNNNVYINNSPLVFYHFADFVIYSPLPFLLSAPLTGYGEISKNRELIYEQYFKLIYKAADEVRKYYPDFKYGFRPRPPLQYLKEAVIEKIVILFRKTKNILSV